MTLYDTSIPAELLTGMRLARGAIGRGELVVIPTDTVYGVAADAFSSAAVARLPLRLQEAVRLGDLETLGAAIR